MPIHNVRFAVATGPHGEIPGPLVFRKHGPVMRTQIAIPSLLVEFLSDRNLSVPQPIEGIGLIDTGASTSCVDQGVIEQLEVRPVGVGTAVTAGGVVEQNLYPVRFVFPDQKMVIEFGSVMGVNLEQYTVMDKKLVALVGRDVLARCVLIYNGVAGSYTLCL